MRSFPLRRIAVFALLFPLAAGNAFANCLFGPIHLRVGADTQNCQYNDIQSAINAVNANDECPTIIDITREHLYTNQHLSIDNKTRGLTLQGWGDGVHCSDIPGNLFDYNPPDSTNPLVTLDGSSSYGSVLYVTGNTNLSIRNLTLTHGNNYGTGDNNAVGGGVHFDGQGSLTLTRSVVSFNNATYGAGIDVSGSSGPATLTLDTDSYVLSNVAGISGGGLRIRHDTRLYALKPNTFIAFNQAPNGYGGGLEVIGPARADIGSPGWGGSGVIDGNSAMYGGGMDILTFDDGIDAIVRLFTTDPAHPVRVQSNTASHTGGAVYMRPHAGESTYGHAVLCAYDFRIDDNIAQEGAAIYGDADYSVGGLGTIGSNIALNTTFRFFGNSSQCLQTEAPTALGAVACAAGTACNRIENNAALDSSNSQPTDGSTILLQDDGYFDGDRVELRGNSGGHVLRTVGDQYDTLLTNALIAGNATTQELAAETDSDDPSLTFDSSTIAGNTIGETYVFAASGLRLYNSIVDQPGVATVFPPITDGDNAKNVLSNDRGTLPDTVYIHQGEPAFVNAAAGDYHLTPTSAGVDSAALDTNYWATSKDLDRKPRVVDLPNVTNSFGPMDLGAYEVQLSAVLSCAIDDTVFCNGFDPP